MRNKIIKKQSAILLAILAFCEIGSAEISTNLGYSSEYYFRGILQKSSSAHGGVDVTFGDLSLGTWAADVGDGLEVDVYGSYAFKWSDDFSSTVGFTHYHYTGEFDKTYQELNLGLSYKQLALDYALGTHDVPDHSLDDYSYLALTYQHNGFYAKYATYGNEFNGDYIELGVTQDLGGFETTLALIISSDELSDQTDALGNPTESEALTLSFSKSFDL